MNINLYDQRNIQNKKPKLALNENFRLRQNLLANPARFPAQNIGRFPYQRVNIRGPNLRTPYPVKTGHVSRVEYKQPVPRNNPFIRYCVFRGFIYGDINRITEVKVGQKLKILRDPGNTVDSNSLKAVYSDSKDKQSEPLGHCDVMTRDLLSEIIEKRHGLIKAEAYVCDFDDEFEAPPDDQFVAQIKVTVLGPLFSVEKLYKYFNLRIKKLEIELHFYNSHQLFKIKSLEEQQEEEFFTVLSRENHKKPETKSEANSAGGALANSFEEVNDDFRAIFSGSNECQNLEPIEPSQLMKTTLLMHQKIGLHWMKLREKVKKDKSLFWHKVESDDGYSYWENEITGAKTSNAPEEFRGGILADDMGLGKTIQTIALIASSDFGQGPTLVVCPVSVMNTWKYQMEEHLEDDSFKVVIYHGPNRKTDTKYLEDFDVVITSYSVISYEWKTFGPQTKVSKRPKSTLAGSSEECSSSDEESDFEFSRGAHSVQWMRVVLDEAHRIRSRKSKKHKAICSLWTERRWCLTGTPIQNKLDDLYALIRFLQVHPLTEIRFWKSMILDPLKIQNPEGLRKL